VTGAGRPAPGAAPAAAPSEPAICRASFDDEPAPTTSTTPAGPAARVVDAGWADGFRLYGGPHPTEVDLADLDAMTRTLDAAAARLDAAAAALRRAADECADHHWQAPAAAGAAFDAVTAAGRSAYGPGSCADDVRDLATRVRHAIGYYDGAESLAVRVARLDVAARASLLGDVPGLALAGAMAVGAVGVVAAGSVNQLVLTTSPLRRLLHHGKDPLLERYDRSVDEVVGSLGSLADYAAADGRGTWEVTAAAAFLRAAIKPGLQVPLLPDPVRAAAGELAARTGEAPPTALVPRVDPPQLPAPRTTADVLANVEATYSESNGGRPGTPPGTITVQRLDHGDGTIAWVVEVPGTQAWLPNSSVPTDLTTNLQQVAGTPDDMTTATVEAMRLAGMRQGDRVLIAGHSQGGMTAMSVAAAVGTYYDVRAVLTAGSPDVPGRVPAGVQVRAYRHTEDLVPQLDGRPDQGSSQVSVVTRRLATTGGPQRPTITQAHSIEEYVRTARLADARLAGSPGMRGYDDAQAEVLGAPGTTQTTMQFRATREPGVLDPATGLPLAPRIEPMYPAAK
jgi:hypothetical protein